MPDKAWNAEDYAAHGRHVSDLAAPVVDLLDPRPGERILDLGCGEGTLGRAIAARGARVLGIDASPSMVAAARASGLDAEMMDAQELPFTAAFDAVFTNAVLHWVSAPERVLAGVYRALKAGGRFVGEFGGHGNVAAVTAALLATLRARGAPAESHGWFYPTAEEFAALLAQAGFVAVSVTWIARPTVIATGLGSWLALFADHLLARLPADQRAAAAAEVEAILTPVLRSASGVWIIDHARLRFCARRPQ